MAKIWLLKSGNGNGELAAEKSLNFCYTTLGLRLRDRLKQQTLVIGTTEDSRTAPSLGLRHAVVEITEDDLTPGELGWQPGYYLLDKDATEVRKLFGID